jgi:hypothetical protein
LRGATGVPYILAVLLTWLRGLLLVSLLFAARPGRALGAFSQHSVDHAPPMALPASERPEREAQLPAVPAGVPLPQAPFGFLHGALRKLRPEAVSPPAQQLRGSSRGDADGYLLRRRIPRLRADLPEH